MEKKDTEKRQWKGCKKRGKDIEILYRMREEINLLMALVFCSFHEISLMNTQSTNYCRTCCLLLLIKTRMVYKTAFVLINNEITSGINYTRCNITRLRYCIRKVGIFRHPEVVFNQNSKLPQPTRMVDNQHDTIQGHDAPISDWGIAPSYDKQILIDKSVLFM